MGEAQWPMTEAEWLACPYPMPLLRFLNATPRARKVRLFACACCRQIWAALGDERIQQAVVVAERYADGLADSEEVMEARKNANQSCHLARGLEDTSARSCGYLTLNQPIYKPAEDCALFAPNCMPCGRDDGSKILGAILRDIFGNPFRPVTFPPSWRTDTAVSLARQMYESRDFSAMPILADALQDAGCDRDDILSHCREPGEHVRGCWVADLVLGKE